MVNIANLTFLPLLKVYTSVISGSTLYLFLDYQGIPSGARSANRWQLCQGRVLWCICNHGGVAILQCRWNLFSQSCIYNYIFTLCIQLTSNHNNFTTVLYLSIWRLRITKQLPTYLELKSLCTGFLGSLAALIYTTLICNYAVWVVYTSMPHELCIQHMSNHIFVSCIYNFP